MQRMVNMIKTNFYTTEEKKEWFGDGEWINEPDLVEFKYKEYDCTILRTCMVESNGSKFGGYLCGYVKIPENNKFYNKNYSSMNIDVHGGLTFAEFKGDGYWIGIDCAHSFDLVPSSEKFKQSNEDMIELRKQFPDSRIWENTYKNISFVEAELKSIVDQIIEVEDAVPLLD